MACARLSNSKAIRRLENMNATENEPNCSSPANPTTEKIGITSAYSLADPPCFAGRKFLHLCNIVQDEDHEKTN